MLVLLHTPHGHLRRTLTADGRHGVGEVHDYGPKSQGDNLEAARA